MQWGSVPPPNQNGIILSYTVTYQALPDGSPRRKVVNTPTTEAKLTGLNPNTNYSITVFASTVKGDGSVSTPIVVLTDLNRKFTQTLSFCFNSFLKSFPSKLFCLLLSQTSSISIIKMDVRCKTLQLIIVIVLQRLSCDHKIRLWIQILHLRILYLLPLSVSIRLEFRCKTSRIIWDPFAAILCYHKVRQSLHNVTIERSEATGCYRDKSGNLVLK